MTTDTRDRPHHVLPVRVYFEDTDAAGIVYYANYLRFAERGRTELLRSLGMDHSGLMGGDGGKNGIAIAVRHCAADYLRPARLDDLLEVRTRVIGVRGATIEMEQMIARGAENLVRVEVRLGCISLDGRAARLPGPVRAAFATLDN